MSRNRLLLLIGVAIGLAVGAFVWWRSAQVRSAWVTALPTVPELEAYPAEFPERVAALTKRAALRDAAALSELGRLYHANGFSREAARVYTGLEQFDAANPQWPHLHAHILAGMGQLADAEVRWVRVVKLAPDYLPGWTRWGDVLLKMNRAEEAAKAYSAALAMEPRNAHVLLGLARCELELGRLTAAREKLQQAVSVRPEFSAGWNLLATIYERLGNREGVAAAQRHAEGLRRFREMADPWLDELLQDCYDVYRLRVAAAAANAAGEPRDALPWLERALRISPQNPAVHRDLGDIHVALRDFAAARVAFERVISLSPTDEVGYLRLATLGLTAGDPALVARAVGEGVAHCPDSAGLWFAHGRQLATAGRTDAALAAFDAARRLQPDNADAYHEIAALCFRLGRGSEALVILEAVLRHLPEHLPTLRALAQGAIEIGDASAASRWLERLRAQTRGAGKDWEDLAQRFQRRFGRVP